MAKNEILWWEKPIERLLLRIKDVSFITPNRLTVCAFISGILAGVFIFISPVLSAVSLCFSYFLDVLDGRLARMRGQSSALGFFADIFFDQIKIGFFLFCAGIRLDSADTFLPVWPVVSAIIFFQFLRELSCFAFKAAYPGEYTMVIADNTRIKEIPFVIFHLIRFISFLHCVQIGVMAFGPLLLGYERMLYVYGSLLFVSFVERIVLYTVRLYHVR